jgi:hypothetical protein
MGMALRVLMGLALIGSGVVVTGCSSSEPVARGLVDVDPNVMSTDEFLGVDRWEVVICRIPDEVKDPTYATDAERLTLDADALAGRLDGVSEYFARWSHGRYSIEWVPAADVVIEPDDTSYDCADRALDASDPTTNGVLVVADAQHDVEAPGGWGRRGERCDRPCAARESRRAAYVGASDFVSYWGDDSPLDLIEHEIGHALGWPHSATSAGVGDNHVYDSDLDVMSNSAAPRELDETRRHAPGVLALNAWSTGWLDDDEIVVVSLDGIRPGDWQDAVRLVASDSAPSETRFRMLVVDLGATWLAVEVVADRGDNDHLDESGVAIHEIVFDSDAPEGRWHVVQPTGTSASHLLGNGGQWSSTSSGLTIRIGEFAVVDGVLGVDVRIRRDAAAEVAPRQP